MKSSILNVATCQFPVSKSIVRNSNYICNLIRQASTEGADVVHFPETALTGYAGVNYSSWENYDWDILKQETEKIKSLAAELNIWIILGSAHRFDKDHLPYNCLYVISNKGKIVERYDKRFCTGGDLHFYSPGDRFATFNINGIKCGCLICYDVRFPELYREYKKLGVQLMFHAFHNAAAEGPTIHSEIMRSTLQARAASNFMWVSATNSSKKYQLWTALFIKPNGHIESSLSRHRTEMTVDQIDLDENLYDASGPWRDRSMQGIFHSGDLPGKKSHPEEESL